MKNAFFLVTAAFVVVFVCLMAVPADSAHAEEFNIEGEWMVGTSYSRAFLYGEATQDGIVTRNTVYDWTFHMDGFVEVDGELEKVDVVNLSNDIIALPRYYTNVLSGKDALDITLILPQDDHFSICTIEKASPVLVVDGKYITRDGKISDYYFLDDSFYLVDESGYIGGKLLPLGDDVVYYETDGEHYILQGSDEEYDLGAPIRFFVRSSKIPVK